MSHLSSHIEDYLAMRRALERAGVAPAANATIRGRVEDADTKKPVTDFSIGRTGPQGGSFFNVQVMMGRGGGPQRVRPRRGQPVRRGEQ